MKPDSKPGDTIRAMPKGSFTVKDNVLILKSGDTEVPCRVYDYAVVPKSETPRSED